jgi:hypothetical protein
MKTVLYLTGSEKGFNKLKRLHETGELANLIGYNILDIQAYKRPIKPVTHGSGTLKTPDLLLPVASKQSWIKVFYHKLKKTGGTLIPQWISGKTLTRKVGWATAAILVLIISWIFMPLLLTHKNRIDTTYQMVLADKQIAMEAGLRVLAFHWEQPPANIKGTPTLPLSSAATAFGAGLLTGREMLLGHSDVALSPRFLPSTPENNWLKTQWADYFELGRWTLLLWTVSQSQDKKRHKTFWDEQRAILAQLQAAFAARQATDNEAKQIVSNLELIKTYLEKLPAGNESEIYEEFGFHLKKMMDFPLVPRAGHG